MAGKKEEALAIKPRETAVLQSKIQAVNNLYRKMKLAFKRGAKYAFEAGHLLWEIQRDLYVGESWQRFAKEHFDFSVQWANSLIRVYLNYKDNPRLLADMSVHGALDKISKPPALPPVPVEYGNPGKQLEFDWEASFKKPTVSKVKLEHYRFECPDRRSLWLVRRGIPIPEKILDLRLDKPQGDLTFFYNEMMRHVQAAVEQYFFQIEKNEEERV